MNVYMDSSYQSLLQRCLRSQFFLVLHVADLYFRPFGETETQRYSFFSLCIPCRVGSGLNLASKFFDFCCGQSLASTCDYKQVRHSQRRLVHITYCIQ